MAEFLIAVWEITGKGDSTRLATQKAIREKIGSIGKVIGDFDDLDYPCIDSFEIFERDVKGNPKPGKPKVAYSLNPKLVSLPRTAIILLELLDYQADEDFLILRDSFVKSIVRKYKFKHHFILARLEAGIDANYIIVQTRGFIWPAVRIRREIEYISLVARKHLDPRPFVRRKAAPKRAPGGKTPTVKRGDT